MAEEKLPYAVRSFHNWSLLAKFYHPLQAGSIDGTDTFPHDKAIWRAVQAKYKPNNKVTGKPRCTIFVGRLSKDTEEASLIKKFSKCGHIKKCRLIRDIVTGFSKGYAFIEYESERDAKIAYREMYKTDIDGREILIEYELERTLPGWIPRRLGGGFGGQKESGQLRFGGRDRPFRRPLPVKTMGQASKFNENTESTDSNRHATTDSNWNRDVERNRNRERDRERDREGDRKRDRDRHRDRDRVRKRNRDRERERDQSRYRDRDVREGRIRDGSGSRHIEGENTGPIDERRLYRDEVKDGSRERSKWKDERADRERHQKK